MKEPLLYKIVRPFIKIGVFLLYRPTFIGLENIPKEGNFVLGGNHTNNFDCLLLMSATKRVIHFLAKDSLMKGCKKNIFKHMGIIPVNRAIHDKEALKNAIHIFGCVKMAYETNAPIIPFIIKGKYNIFRNNLCITFLKPYKVTQDLTQENEKLMHLITKELKEKRK